MKKLILFLVICSYNFQGYAQDPDLYQTLYLHFFQSSDLSYPYEISEISPSINPSLEIFEDLNFNGEGACNTYEGVFNHLGTNDIETSFFDNTNNDCGIQIHNNFENEFFEFINTGFWYEITQDSEGLTLTFETPIFGYALFKNYPLSTIDNSFNKLKIYPNPVSSILYISSEINNIETITIYFANGIKVITIENKNNSIDISNLSNGLYFVEISSKEGKLVKKFIKK